MVDYRAGSSETVHPGESHPPLRKDRLALGERCVSLGPVRARAPHFKETKHWALSNTSPGVDDFVVAEAAYRAAVARWPRARITLRQGIRVVHDIR